MRSEEGRPLALDQSPVVAALFDEREQRREAPVGPQLVEDEARRRGAGAVGATQPIRADVIRPIAADDHPVLGPRLGVELHRRTRSVRFAEAGVVVARDLFPTAVAQDRQHAVEVGFVEPDAHRGRRVHRQPVNPAAGASAAAARGRRRAVGRVVVGPHGLELTELERGLARTGRRLDDLVDHMGHGVDADQIELDDRGVADAGLVACVDGQDEGGSDDDGAACALQLGSCAEAVDAGERIR